MMRLKVQRQRSVLIRIAKAQLPKARV